MKCKYTGEHCENDDNSCYCCTGNPNVTFDTPDEGESFNIVKLVEVKIVGHNDDGYPILELVSNGKSYEIDNIFVGAEDDEVVYTAKGISNGFIYHGMGTWKEWPYSMYYMENESKDVLFITQEYDAEWDGKCAIDREDCRHPDFETCMECDILKMKEKSCPAQEAMSSNYRINANSSGRDIKIEYVGTVGETSLPPYLRPDGQCNLVNAICTVPRHDCVRCGLRNAIVDGR